jgi:lysophospholipase L1-like esterase
MGEFDEISYRKASAVLTLANSLAGAGRTTETVKGNADTLANIAKQTVISSDKTISNIVTNGNFPNTTGWTGVAATLAVANNTLSITGNGTGTAAKARFTTAIAATKYRRLYVRAKVRVTNAVAARLGIMVFDPNGSKELASKYVLTPTENEWYTVSLIMEGAIEYAGNLRVYATAEYADNATENGKVCEVQEFFGVDLGVDGTNVLYFYTTADLDTLLPAWFSGSVTKSIESLEYLKNTNPWYNKRVVAMGDSITFGANPALDPPRLYDNWLSLVAKSLKMRFVNYGINGSTVAVKEADPTGRDPVITRYAGMETDVDLVVVSIGTNDFQYNWTPLGDMSARTDYTYYGALHNLCAGLLEMYHSIPIIFLTPIKRNQSPYTTPISVNDNSKTLKEYGDIIKEVCAYYSIPVLDMYTDCQINPHITTQKALYMSDGVHPTEAGHVMMARRIAGYLKQFAN